MGKSQPNSAPGGRWSRRNWGKKGSLGCGGFQGQRLEGSHSGLPITPGLAESGSFHKCVTCLQSATKFGDHATVDPEKDDTYRKELLVSNCAQI